MAPSLKWKRSGSQKKKRKKNDDVGGIRIQYTGREFGRNLYSQKIPKLSPRLWLARLNSAAAELLGHDKRMVSLDVWETLWHLYCANSKTTARVTRRRRRKLIGIEEATWITVQEALELENSTA